MKRRVTVAYAALLCASGFCAKLPHEIVPSATPQNGTYALYVEARDWGVASYKVVINAGQNFASSAVQKEDFVAGVYLANKKKAGRIYGPAQSERDILSAYVCDDEGEEVAGRGRYIALEFAVSPDDVYTGPYVFYKKPRAADDIFGMKITNEKLGIEISRRSAIVFPTARRFATDKAESLDEDGEKITLQYSYYIPQTAEGAQVPLILWLHGMGEGGDDVLSPLLNSPAAKLTGEAIQSHFDEGCAVLIPVCHSGWLETTEKDPMGKRLWVPVDIKGTVKKVASPMTKLFGRFIYTQDDYEEVAANKTYNTVSYYTGAVKKLVEDFITCHPEIDAHRVYVGGASAGGYMTVNMLLQCPELFAAAFAVCEAYPDERISAAQIDLLAEQNIWFAVALNDETVNPQKCTIATYERLKNAGAQNAHICTYPRVIDIHGFTDEDGYPFEYEGHYSWIYVLDDRCVSDGDKTLSLFDWLSRQSRDPLQ